MYPADSKIRAAETRATLPTLGVRLLRRSSTVHTETDHPERTLVLRKDYQRTSNTPEYGKVRGSQHVRNREEPLVFIDSE